MTQKDPIDAWIDAGLSMVKKAQAFQKDMEAAMQPHDWEVGDRASKVKGYEFDSEVRAVFTNKEGKTRLVCESLVIPGMLHIFSPEQMRPMKDLP